MSTSDEADQKFYSAKSDFSEDFISLDNVSAGAVVSEIPPMRPSSTDERSRILSEEKNQLMNEKIDRLIAVLQNGHYLHFSPDLQTGNVGISVVYEKSESVDGRSNLKARIATSPENFGNIIKAGDYRQRIRGVSSVLLESTSAPSDRKDSSSSAWESVVTSDIGYALDHESEARKANPAEAHDVRGYEGRYITNEDKNDVKVCTVSPIPLVFNKPPRLTTPSLHSSGSDLDVSSPLFEKSLKASLREIGLSVLNFNGAGEVSEPSSIEESVSSWLERVKTPPGLERQTDSKGKQEDFNVFQDSKKYETAIKRNTGPATTGKTLKDISNLRRPRYPQHNNFAKVNKTRSHSARPEEHEPMNRAFRGAAGAESRRPAAKADVLNSPQPEYLKYNSFAKASKPVIILDAPRENEAMGEPFGVAMDARSRRSFKQAKWPILMPHNSPRRTADPAAPERHLEASANIVTCNRERLPLEKSTPEKPILQDPNRAADFDFALARLEGRVPPQQYSPIRRYADVSGVYGPNVEVERRHLRPHQPVPRRKLVLGPTVARNFERAVEEGVENKDREGGDG